MKIKKNLLHKKPTLLNKKLFFKKYYYGSTRIKVLNWVQNVDNTFSRTCIANFITFPLLVFVCKFVVTKRDFSLNFMKCQFIALLSSPGQRPGQLLPSLGVCHHRPHPSLLTILGCLTQPVQLIHAPSFQFSPSCSFAFVTLYV